MDCKSIGLATNKIRLEASINKIETCYLFVISIFIFVFNSIIRNLSEMHNFNSA